MINVKPYVYNALIAALTPSDDIEEVEDVEDIDSDTPLDDEDDGEGDVPAEDTPTPEPLADVSDEFPKEWKTFPKVTFTEEQNEVITWTDDEEKDARIVYRIDVWDKVSTSAIVALVDSAMAGLGFLRTMCMDVPVQELYKHKQLRYECIISVDTEDVFHES